MNTIPPAAPPPRRSRWPIITVLLLLILCLCCVGALVVLWTQGDAMMFSLCQNAVLPESLCRSLGVP
jgi:hypothetical protein